MTYLITNRAQGKVRYRLVADLSQALFEAAVMGGTLSRPGRDRLAELHDLRDEYNDAMLERAMEER